MGRTTRPITVTVRAADGSPLAHGVVYAVALTGACIATSILLAAGEMLRFRIFNHDPPSIAERLGRVLWAKKSINPAGNHIARCQVVWLSASEASEL